MKKVAVKAVVSDKTGDLFKGRGFYYMTGRVRCVIDEFDGLLEIDPRAYHPKNPRRLMYRDENGDFRWSRYYLHSMLADVKPVKTQIKTKKGGL